MPTAYSTEGKIETGLRELQCSGRSFVKCAKVCGIAISDGKFSEALSDKKQLDIAVGEKLLGLLGEMAELKSASLVTPDWADAQSIGEQLSQRRAFKQAVKYDADVTQKLILEPRNAE